jgi:hypothetical protein
MDKKRIQKRTRHPIEIPLLFRPRPYTRGSGPALAPLRIALKNDSTAYITEKTILPTHTKNGQVKLQLHYLVGWTDLSAASVAVPATSILDYVSSRTLEDFEYKLSLERDEQEEQERKRKAAKAKKSLVPSASVPGAAPNTPSKPTKKRGRPSKADLLMRQAAKAHMEDVSLLPLAAASQEPSLSTPQKPLQNVDVFVTDEDLDDEVEEADHDDDADHAIFQQLYGEGTGTRMEVDDLDTLVSDLDDPLSTPVLLKTPTKVTNKPVSDPNGALSSLLSSANMNGSISQPRDPRNASVASGFTLAGRSSGRWPSRSRSHTPVGAKTATPQYSSDTPAKVARKKKKSVGPVPVHMEPIYEVKRVEGDKVLSIDGKQRRWYRVRWEGNWPADQNPTWEPEENLPRNLVQKYLKRKASRTNGLHIDVNEAGMSPVAPPRKYSSVAEAFAGEAEYEAHRNTPKRQLEDDDEEEDERLLVEEGESTPDPLGPVPLPKTQSINLVTARDFGAFKANGNGHHHESPTQF